MIKPAALLELHQGALDNTRNFVVGARSLDWSAPTPCADWTVRELLNHVVGGNWWASRLASGATIEDVGSALDGDQLGPDALAAYDRSAAAAAAAFAGAGALDAPCAVSYGPVPGAVYAGHRFLDVLIHGWDLAVATGQEPALPTDLVAGCWQVLEPQLEMLRASGMFGADLPIPEDADAETRLLLTLGRRP
ncbi:MAG: TIGR03086 family metal-binding protein [Acidimicrobiia bacterium]